ncbi:MAG: hypothetical protein JWM76_1561 [Pseudonocardiales bacterium]|nr:hypothetical protein [Pseudonocardiales bacterium]
MIDVVQALELLEICVDEMADEDAGSGPRGGVASRRRMSLTSRALAKGQLDVGQLGRFLLRGGTSDTAAPDEPTMTLGALIVFRTANKFGRAGASTARTMDAVYNAVQRYVEILPSSLQDRTDTSAIGALLTEEENSPRVGRRQQFLTLPPMQ